MRIAKILVALDGSHDAERAVPAAIELAKQNGNAKVVLVRAVEPATSGGDSAIASPLPAINEAAAYLCAVAARFRSEGIHPIVRSVWYAAAGHTITEVARRVRPSVIVMTSCHRDDAGRLTSGPLTEFVRNRTQIPILLVATRGRSQDRPAGREAGEETELVHA